MSFLSYLADRALPLVVRAAVLAFVALVMAAYGTEQAVIWFLCAVLALGAVVALVLDYLHRRGFYRQLAETLAATDDKTLVPELLDRPECLEAQLFYDALAEASRDMRERMAASRRREREHAEYIETWVHEIKTPVAAAHLIARNNPAPATDAMDAEVDTIEGYVEQALYYSRAGSLERDFQIRAVTLADVVRDAVRHKARTLIDAGVTPELGAGLDLTVRADPKWLSFAVGQLLVNAAKYRRQDGEPGHVRVSAERRETGMDAWETVLSVADDGIGVPASDVGRVFDKGFTGENGRRFARSTGIGLYLVRELCQKMGLRVWMESQEGVGTTVAIAFPDSARRA